MFSLSNVNQYRYVTRRISFVVAYGTPTQGVMGLNRVQVKTCFFHSVAMFLFYIIQRITIPKFCISRKYITMHHCMALLQVALVSIPPHKFVRPPYWYYRLYEI
jgi:hypothetical protein